MSNAPSRKELTHDRIVEVAARALRRGGFEGVGVADVMKEAGLTHGGFYAHFESRNALLVEATERAGRDSGAVLAERMAQRQAEGASPFNALVSAYLGEQQLANAEFGCPVAALASEIPRQADKVGDAARHRVVALINAVQRVLPQGTDPAQAPAVAAALVGSVQLARALGGKPGRALLATARQNLITQYEGG
jgi:TetR/AcrR family transcriptional repressor of nem operon